jgi:sulfhydrogenase subunit alpha
MTTSRAIEAAVRGRRPAQVVALFAGMEGHERTAYRTCACRALEAADRRETAASVEVLRRLLGCAAWIEGHTTHLHRVQIPDLIGHSGAADLIDREPAAVRRGLDLHLAGLELAEAVGEDALRAGGPVHPPEPSALSRARGRLEEAVDAALRTVGWIGGIDVPSSMLDIPLLALDDPVPGPVAHGRARYPLDGGVGVLTSTGLGFPLGEFESYISRPRSGPPRAGRAALRGAKAALTGPLARNALCGRFLHPAARAAADLAGLTAAERNPYRSALIRAVELVHAIEEAVVLIDGYQVPDPPHPQPPEQTRAGRGFAAVESPSGLLYQRYDVLPDGTVGAVRLIRPEELNRTAVELDLRRAERTARRRDPEIGPDALATLRTELAHNYDLGDASPAHGGTIGPDRRAHPARP